MIRRVPDRKQADIMADRQRHRAERLAQLSKLRRGERVSSDINVKIKRLHPDAKIPAYATDLAAGFDLVAVEDVVIAPGETAKIPLGLAFEIPAGYVMIVCMRSGVALRTALRQPNGIGVIDADYRGEVAMMFDNIAKVETEVFETVDYDYEENPYVSGYGTKEVAGVTYDLRGEDALFSYGYHPHGTYIIRAGDRVAQAFVLPYPRVNFEVVTELSESERGTGGFGSTGTEAHA